MAKVKIQGHASGTGVLTVTAPNTNTDRTITLPDGTGTLIADNGSGKVGIGVTSPAVTLELAGGGGAIRVPTGGELQFGGSANKIYGHASNNYLRFDTNSTERMRVTDNGLTFNGDTTAANALDDYEEGTWTPVLGGTSESGQSYGSQVGRYTKIGNMVFCHAHLALTNKGTINGFTRIKGFPFTVSPTNAGAASFAYTKQISLSADHILEGWVYTTNVIYLYESDHSNDDPSQIGAGGMNNTTSLSFSFFFTTTD